MDVSLASFENTAFFLKALTYQAVRIKCMSCSHTCGCQSRTLRNQVSILGAYLAAISMAYNHAYSLGLYLSYDGNLLNIPLYLADELERIIKLALKRG